MINSDCKITVRPVGSSDQTKPNRKNPNRRKFTYGRAVQAAYPGSSGPGHGCRDQFAAADQPMTAAMRAQMMAMRMGLRYSAAMVNSRGVR